MMPEERINPNDLVLRFSSDIDISRYYDFIDVLCQDREYQKEAIKKAIKFFLEGKYINVSQLMIENYKTRKELRSFFNSEEDYLKDVKLKNKKAVTLDLATGTGKTWVMYGVAQILLAEGLVDQILVLCPSVTIKNQLVKRFREFSEDENLKKVLPRESKIKNPEIHDAQHTINRGDLCVHNVHAIYERVSSSIKDSLQTNKKGERTLVINDEAHHYLNKTDKDMKLWGEFLENSDYGFNYILNVTGTPYKENVYFKNVISRFSIKEAIDQKFIKDILYKTETPKNLSEFEKFDLIYKHHTDNSKKYNKLKKTITLFVTSSISEAKELETKFKRFLTEKKRISSDEANNQVLIVTSASEHKNNLILLENVDSDENLVEWIISVSMLNEGWDVKKVFQIVPHEKRAFNSKLLISQVLGRGLRLPLEYEESEELPQLIVANHASWSKEIEEYVYAVSEIGRITSAVFDSKNKFNFEIDYLNSEKKEVREKRLVKHKKETKIPYIPDLESSRAVAERLKSIKTHQTRTVSTSLDSESYHTSEEIALRIYNEIWLTDVNQGTKYLSRISKAKLNEDIIKACKKASIDPHKIDFRNREKVLRAFDVLKRTSAASTRVKMVYSDPIELKTKDLPSSRISVPQLKESSIFRGIFFDDFYKESDEESLECINELNRDRIALRNSIINKISSDFEFKTPQGIVICDSENEIKFVERLINKNKNIFSWVKNDAHSKFYAIPYDYREGSHSKNLNFNPDFIIKTDKLISIVEIKFGGDISDINKAKRKGADKFIKELNKKSENRFALSFLGQKDFEDYFVNVIEKSKLDWDSEMDKKLRE
jgi:type III restriction enzyme